MIDPDDVLNARVLIVDDQEANVLLLQRMHDPQATFAGSCSSNLASCVSKPLPPACV